jgi:hypothetical protein
MSSAAHRPPSHRRTFAGRPPHLAPLLLSAVVQRAATGTTGLPSRPLLSLVPLTAFARPTHTSHHWPPATNGALRRARSLLVGLVSGICEGRLAVVQRTPERAGRGRGKRNGAGGRSAGREGAGALEEGGAGGEGVGCGDARDGDRNASSEDLRRGAPNPTHRMIGSGSVRRARLKRERSPRSRSLWVGTNFLGGPPPNSHLYSMMWGSGLWMA